MKFFEKRDLIILIPIGILLSIQIPNLSLPYFWDEAWSYFTSIKKMADSGPSLLPGAVPIDYCKGHPQFYFFITSIWMNIFPDNIPMMRVFSLMISSGVLISIYFGLKRIINWESGVFASFLVSTQTIFIAQSIFLLPEMLITLLFFVSFFFFMENKFLPYAIISSLMVLSKETAIIFCICFGIFYLLSFIDKTNRKKFKTLNLVCLLVPAIVYGFFLLLHYFKFGMFLYSEHINFILYDWASVSGKIKIASGSIFLSYGRITISVATLVLLIVFLFQKKVKYRAIIVLAFSFLLYMAFTVYNFFTIRYGLVAIAIFLVIFSIIISQIKIQPLIKSIIVLGLGIYCFTFIFTRKTNGDIDMGYVDAIKVHEEIVHYCEENNLYNESFAVTFNMIFNLRDKNLGYVKGSENFTDISDWKSYKEARYFIFESTFGDADISIDYAKNNFKLVKSFSSLNSWGHIYENTNIDLAQSLKEEIVNSSK